MKVSPLPSARRYVIIFYIAAWFIANGSTVIFNKYIFQRMGFQCPLTLTLIHMSTQATLAYVTIDVLGMVDKVTVDPADYWSKLIVIAAVFCCNICLGNVSLRYVPVSFMQTVKSLTPVTTAGLQYMIFGSRLAPQALVSLIPVTFGVALASLTELEFHLGGFVAALMSCVLTGLKFVLSSQMLAGRYKLDSINLLYYMAPPSVMLLFPMCIMFETSSLLAWTGAPDRTTFDYVLLLMSGVVSFILNVCLFVVLKATSSVTVTVAGNVKTVAVIAVSIAIFRNPVTPINFLGCLTAVMGCMWYGLLPVKWATMGTFESGVLSSKNAKEEAHNTSAALPVTVAGADSDSDLDKKGSQ
jgi:drug/metabolite transporter (DMT)-like permease